MFVKVRSRHNKLLLNVLLPLVLLTLLLAVGWGCRSDNNGDDNTTTPMPPVVEEPTDKMEIERLITELPPVEELFYLDGSPDVNHIVLASQGGPSPFLETGEFDFLEEDGFIVAYLYHYQMYDPSCMNIEVVSRTASRIEYAIRTDTTEPVSVERSYECSLNSVAIQRKVTKHFLDMGKDVSLITHSLGTFISQKYLAEYGATELDRVVLGAGRIDMPLEVVDSFEAGMLGGFPDGETFMVFDGVGGDADEFETDAFGMPTTIVLPAIIDDSNTRTSITRLQSSVGRPRYSEELAGMDLSNVLYVCGELDRAVGRLSPAEISFLKGQGAYVVCLEGNGHDLDDGDGPIIDHLRNISIDLTD